MRFRCILIAILLLFSGKLWAQLVCTNCTIGGRDYVFPDKGTILAAGATAPYTGPIILLGEAVFNMESAGVYELHCVISERGVARGLSITASNASGNNIAGEKGKEASLIFSGSEDNTYTGTTKLDARATLVLNKVAGKAAIPGRLSMKGGNSNVWCLADEQFGAATVVDFTDAGNYPRINLYGTTQTVAGLISNGNAAILQNFEMAYAPPFISAIPTTIPVLNVTGTGDGTIYTYGPRSVISPAGLDINNNAAPVAAKKLVLTIKGSGQRVDNLNANGGAGNKLVINGRDGTFIFKNPTSGITSNIDFHSTGTIVFHTDTPDEYSLGTNCTISGNGVYRKTGPGTISGNNSTFNWSGATLYIDEGTFRNGMDYNRWADSKVGITLSMAAVLDLWGNNTVIDGLRGLGIVQNNQGSTVDRTNSWGEGYSNLTIGIDNSRGDSPLFEGVIRDNATNGPVSAEGYGKGGIALLKVGTGVQRLSGMNLYTGRTSVVSGALKLEGNGLLGGGNYAGTLEIGSEESSSEVTFENQGNLTQILSGNIAGSATRFYRQTGTGKTIIRGSAPKTFKGVVMVSNGFFGGDGDLSNVSGVAVGYKGSIGGGNGTKDNGGVLKVGALMFTGISTRVVVTNMSSTNNNPSVIDVRTSGGASGSGTVSISGSFIVDLVGGADMLGGTILKAAIPNLNELRNNQPLVGLNNTGKTPCFKWTTTGLEMTLLSDAGGNPLLVLSPAAGKDVTRLCSGTHYANCLTISNSGGATHSASFVSDVGINTYNEIGTSVAISAYPQYSITAGGVSTVRNQEVQLILNVGDKRCVTNRLPITINPNAAIADNATDNVNLAALCGATTYANAITISGSTSAGTWTFFKDDGTTADNSGTTGIAGSTATQGSIITGGVAASTSVKVAYSVAGCNSNQLTLTIGVAPVFSFTDIALCSGASIVDFGPATNGLGDRRAERFKWTKISGGSVELADFTADWSKSHIDGFTAPAVTEATTAVYEATAISGDGSANTCTAKKNVTIAVYPTPSLADNTSDGFSLASLCGRNTYTDAINVSGAAPNGIWALYKNDGTTPDDSGTTVVRGSDDGKATITTAAVSATTTVKVVYRIGTCTSQPVTLTIVPAPAFTFANVTLCSGASMAAFGPNSNGAGVARAARFKWKKKGAASAGLADFTSNWSKTMIDAFTAAHVSANTTAAYEVTGLNGDEITGGTGSETGCSSTTTFTVTITGNTTIAKGSGFARELNNLCEGVDYTDALSISPAPAELNSGTWAVTGGGATSATSVDGGTWLGKASIITEENTGDAPVTRYITYTPAGGCASNRLEIKIHARPFRPPVLNFDAICIGGATGYTVSAIDGSEDNKATGYAWEAVDINQPDIGLADNLRSADSPMTDIGTLTAIRSGVRQLWVYSYNKFGCVNNNGRELSAIVNPSPVITANLNAICAGVNGNPNAVTLTANADPAAGNPWSITAGADNGYLEDGGEGDRIATLRVSNVAITTSRTVTVRYTQNTSCQGSITITIHPNTTIADNPTDDIDLASLCGRNTYINAIVVSNGSSLGTLGTWKFFKSDGITADDSGTTGATGMEVIIPGSFTTGRVTGAAVLKVAYSYPGCESNRLTLNIAPGPDFTFADISLCSGATKADFGPDTNGTGSTLAIRFKWKNTGTVNVGLADHITDWSKSMIDGFTASNVTYPASAVYEVTASVGTTDAACTSTQRINVTVNPTPTLADNSSDNVTLTALCGAAAYPTAVSMTGAGNGIWKVFKNDGITPDDTGTTVEISGEGSAARVNLNTGAVTASTNLKAAYTYPGCSSNLLPITIDPAPDFTFTDLGLCANSSKAAFGPATNGAGVFQANRFKWINVGTREVGLADYTADWSKTMIDGFTAVDASAASTIFEVTGLNGTTGTGCTAKKRFTISVGGGTTIAGTISLASLCGNNSYTDALTVTGASSTGAWKIYKSDGTTPDDSGTAIAAGTNFRLGTIRAGAVTAATTLKLAYSIGGCESNQIAVTINPAPNYTFADFTLCAGGTKTAFGPTTNGTGGAEAFRFKWRILTAKDIGLPNYTANWSKTMIDGFTAPTVTAVTTAAFEVTAINGEGTNPGCVSTKQFNITLSPAPSIADNDSDSFSLTSLCGGNTYTGIITISNGNSAGLWKLFKGDGTPVDDARVSLFNGNVNRNTLTIPAVAAPTPVRVAYTYPGCSSNLLTFIIVPSPVFTFDDFSVCSGVVKTAFSPTTNGTGAAQANRFKWTRSGTTGPDSYTADWSKAAIDGFTTPTDASQTKTTYQVTGINGDGTTGNSGTGCTSTAQFTVSVNPIPTIADNAEDTFNTQALCGGTIYANAITVTGGTSTGIWKVYKQDGTTIDDTGTTVAGAVKGTITTGTATTASAMTLATVRYSNSTCESNLLPVNIGASPIFTFAGISLCSGAVQAAFAPATNGSNGTEARRFKWRKLGGDTVGLADFTTDWSKAMLTGFTAPVTTSRVTATFEVTGLNRNGNSEATTPGSGCSSKTTFTISIGAGPSLAAAGEINLSNLCGETVYDNVLTISPVPSAAGTWSLYTNASGTTEAASAIVAGTAWGKAKITTEENTGPTSLVRYAGHTNAAGCVSNRLAVTIRARPATLSTTALSSLCARSTTTIYPAVIAPPNAASEDTRPTAFAWEALNAQQAGIGLADNPRSANAPTAGLGGNGFTPIVGIRQIIIYSYNKFGCVNPVGRTTAITVKPAPTITLGSPSVCVTSNGAAGTTTLTADQDPAQNAAWRMDTSNDYGMVIDGVAGDRLATFRVTASLQSPQTATVKYTNRLGCIGTANITINPVPAIANNNHQAGNAGPYYLCGGNNYVDAITVTGGSPAAVWKVFKADGITPDDTGTTGMPGTDVHTKGSINIGAITADTNLKIALTYPGCTSNQLLFEVKKAPVFTFNDILLHPGDTKAAFGPDANGTGDNRADRFKWRKVEGTSVGLANYIDDWSKTLIDNFTASPVTKAASAIYEVTAGSDATTTGCTSKKRFTITVNPANCNLSIADNATDSYTLTSLCGANTYTHAVIVTGGTPAGVWKIYKADGTTDEDSGTTVANGAIGKATIITSAVAALTTMKAAYSEGGCMSNTLAFTLNPSPAFLFSNISLCSGTTKTAFGPTTNGTGSGQANRFKWVNTGTISAGLGNYTADWSKTMIDGFTPLTVTSSTSAIYEITGLNGDGTTGGTNSGSGCSSKTIVTITLLPPPPSIAATTGTNLANLCEGAVSYDNAITLSPPAEAANGIWAIYTTETGTTQAATVVVAGTAVGKGKITTENNTGTTALTRYITYSTDASCSSNRLAVTIHARPALLDNIIVPNICEDVNPGPLTLTVTPTPAGDENQPTAYAWELNGTTNVSDIGLADNPRSAESPGATIGGFIPKVGVRDIAIYSYNRFGCVNKVNRRVTTITVNARPVITPGGNGICAVANGVANATSLTANHDPAQTSAWVINPADPAALVEDGITTDRAATFKAASTTLPAQKQINVQYTDNKGCLGTTVITINPSPSISEASRETATLSRLCATEAYPNIITIERAAPGTSVANWQITPNAIGTSMINRRRGNMPPTSASVVAGEVTTATAALQGVTFTAANGCVSNTLTLTINPSPIINNIADLSLCTGQQQAAFIPATTGSGLLVPTNYKWENLRTTDDHGNVGLNDYTTDWSKTAIDGFTANVTSTTKRDITVTPYNAASGCVGNAQDFTITVNTGLTIEYDAPSPICNGTETSITLRSTATRTRYVWTVDRTTEDAGAQAIPQTNSFIRQRLTNSAAADVTVTYKVTGNAAGIACGGMVFIPITVAKDSQTTTPLVSGAGHYCVEVSNATYQTNLIPSITGAGATEWIYYSYTEEGQPAAAVTGNTQKTSKGPLTAVQDNLVLSCAATMGRVYYVFRPFTGNCLGQPTAPVSITVHAAPSTTATPLPAKICSGTAANVVLASTTSTDVKYTWSVDQTKVGSLTGYSQPSEAGAHVTNEQTQPTDARTGPINDVLSLPLSARGEQTIDYWVKPWLAGCSGQAVKATVTVHPVPVVNAPADRTYCIGATVEAEALTGANASTFVWTGGAIAGLNDQTVYGSGLPAYTISRNAVGPVTISLTSKSDKGCVSAPVSFTITVLRKPAATITGGDSPFCLGDSGTLSAKVKGEPVQYQWFKENTKIDEATSYSYTIPTSVEMPPTKYSLTVSNGCDSKTIDKIVEVAADAYFRTAAVAVDKATPATGELVTATYTGPSATYLWDFNDEGKTSSQRTAANTYQNTGTYDLTLKATKSALQPQCTRNFHLSITVSLTTGDPDSHAAFSLFPIPANDFLTIQSESELKNITVSDLEGKKILSTEAVGYKAIISVKNMSAGIYILTAEDTRGMRHLKFVKE